MRKYHFEITDEQALLQHCPTALVPLEPRYKKNYNVIATLIEASRFTGQSVPGVKVIDEVAEQNAKAAESSEPDALQQLIDAKPRKVFHKEEAA